MKSYKLFVFAVALLATPLWARQAAAQETQTEPQGRDTVLFEASRGNVTFLHVNHRKVTECVTCHHESKPEKPLNPAGPSKEKCSACHTNPATEPMQTTLRKAMHDTSNKVGLCYDCHKKEAEAGKTTPAACNDCHKKVEQ